MKAKIKYGFIMFLTSLLSITGCDSKNDVSPDDVNSSSNSHSEVVEPPYVRDETYDWSLEGKEFVKGENTVVVAHDGEARKYISLKVGTETFKQDHDNPVKFSINYTGYGINSDNSNNAADYIYLNGEKLQKIPSDGSKGVSLDEELLLDGENTVTVTIGRYWSTIEYNESLNHGNEWQKGCDDFQLSDFRITLPENASLYPTKIRRYYPIEVGIPAKNNNTKIVEEDYDPSEVFWIGDGWGTFDTYYGHPDARYNIPFKVEFVFDYYRKEYFQFKVDSTKFEDGQNKFSIYEGDVKVISDDFIIDNTKPEISTNFVDNSRININVEKIESYASDALSGIEETYVKLDGQDILPTDDLSNISKGKHTILAYAKDKAGNDNYATVEFIADTTGKFTNYEVTNIDTGAKYTSDENFAMTAYEAHQISDITAIQGGRTHDDLAYAGETITFPNTMQSNDLMPYQKLSFKSKDDGKVFIKYDGGTTPYEKFVIKAKNNRNQKYDVLARGIGSQILTFEMDVTDYVAKGQVELVIENDFVNSGSDTMLWVTDTQHYTKFPDLNDMLYTMMRYCANEYKEGKAGYFIHTGDLVDDSHTSTADTSIIKNQWEIASRAHKIVEDSGLPNGVVTGNHDTGTSLETLNYSYFETYFGQDRFNNKPWFGGSLNNNASHYDLITIGGKDFMIVYLGYGVEGREDTIAWANDVISRYKNRTVILTTHDYLEYNGGNGRASESSRYQTIFDKIVVPNENVRMVLCGHDNGAFDRKVEVPGTDRYIYEILSDYQFVDSNPKDHVIGSVEGCSGDGYLRRMTFTDTEMITETYTPYFDRYNYFGNRDNFTIKMNYVDTNRMISTSSIEIYELGNATTYDMAKTQTITSNSGTKYVVRLDNGNNCYDYHII